MGTSISNPYAPPTAALVEPERVRAVVRVGRDLEAMRHGEEAIDLPDRCVLCNADAGGFRSDSTLTWITPWMRIAATASIPAAIIVSGALGEVLAAGLLGLGVLLAITAAVTRKRILVVHGICPRHRRIRRHLRTAFWVLLAATLAASACALAGVAPVGITATCVLAALIIVGLLANSLRTWSMRIARLDAGRVRLGGTARAFRESFPAAED